jgi:hypothetical protein
VQRYVGTIVRGRLQSSFFDGFPKDASGAADVGVGVHLDAGADSSDAADGDGAVVVPDANDGGPPTDAAGDVADAFDGD